jgi:O-antigen ligase
MQNTQSPILRNTPKISSPVDYRYSIQTDPGLVKQRSNWLSVILVSVYFISLWEPPWLPIPALTWYILLGLAVLAYLFQGERLKVQSASVFWAVYGLGFLGAAVSLLRSADLDGALWATVGLGISFVIYMLFIPVLATPTARKVLLIILIASALLWTTEIQNLLAENSVLIYSTFGETGSNKNFIGFCLSLASTALFYLAVFGQVGRRIPAWLLLVGRTVMATMGVYCFYNLSLIYARAGVLTTFVGIGCVIGVILLKEPQKWRAVFTILLVLGLIGGAIYYFAPLVLQQSPQWEKIFNDLMADSGEAYYFREQLLRKGIYIVSENPILGIGAGQTKDAIYTVYESFPGYLIHNSYLTDWAEKGILGLLSNVVWVLVYLRILRQHFMKSSVTDQLWLILFIPLFFDMLFINMSSVSMTMLAILTGISYQYESVNG